MLQIKKKNNAKSEIDPGIESFNAINELCLNLNFIITQSRQYLQKMKPFGRVSELDPVGSTVRYKMMKLCTGSVKHRQTLKNRATQLFRSGSGALVTQFCTGNYVQNEPICCKVGKLNNKSNFSSSLSSTEEAETSTRFNIEVTL